MRTFLFFLPALLFSLATFAQQGQYAKSTHKQPLRAQTADAAADNAAKALDWAMVTDFEADDINGNHHHLQDYLDDGKTVVVDLSCAWCNPCWQYHQSGVLTQLHNRFGPSGTESQDMIILWVEIEETNTLEQIRGNHVANTYAGASQGDFTENGEWPVPIIDDASIVDSFNELFDGGVPAIFMVCPSGAYRSLETDMSATQIHNLSVRCPSPTTPPFVEIFAPDSADNGLSVHLRSDVISYVDITNYAWTFEGGTPATANTAEADVVFDTNGAHEVTFYATNENGNSDTVRKTIKVITCEEVAVTQENPFRENFNDYFCPVCWSTIDNDGDGYGWNFEIWYNRGVTNDSSANLASSASFINGIGALHPDNWLISPALAIPAGLTTTLKFNVSGLDRSDFREKYGVYVSTTGLETTDFESKFEGTTTHSWQEKAVDLSEYGGQTIHIAFRHYNCTNQFWFLLDSLSITAVVNTGNSVTDNESVLLFPNPVNDKLTIVNAAGANILIINMLGESVLTIPNAKSNEVIDVSGLAGGTYFAKIDGSVWKFSIIR